MKITIKAKRGHGTPWCGNIGGRQVTACPSDVRMLFDMGQARATTFEISNVRPSDHEDYHVFEFNNWGHYGLIEATAGPKPSITTHTSRVIRDAFLAKKQMTSPIYVGVL